MAYAPHRPAAGGIPAQVIAGTNELRRERDLPAVRASPQLDRAAERFARFMASRDEYGHEADGRTPTDRARAEGYRECMVAENIAYRMRTRGFETKELAEGLVRGWFNSPGHRRNMLDAEAVETGVGVAYSDETSRYYAVQLFGRPESMRITFTVRNESRSPVAYRVGDQAWTVPPRAERRHQVCQDLDLVIDRRQGERVFKPEDGDLYTIGGMGRIEQVPPRPPIEKAKPRRPFLANEG
jgi:hypothetical protein